MKLPLIKIDRIGAWILLISILLFFISGFGMAKGLFDYNFAKLMHFTIIPSIGILALVTHTSLAVRLSLMRWRIWTPASKYILIGIYVLIFISFYYLSFIYQPISGNNPSNAQNIISSPQALKYFTKDELVKYNGLNGQPAYAAIDGKVYDLSAVFRNGMHNLHPAGTESTSAFYQQHMKAILQKFPVVGLYKE